MEEVVETEGKMIIVLGQRLARLVVCRWMA